MVERIRLLWPVCVRWRAARAAADGEGAIIKSEVTQCSSSTVLLTCTFPLGTRIVHYWCPVRRGILCGTSGSWVLIVNSCSVTCKAAWYVAMHKSAGRRLICSPRHHATTSFNAPTRLRRFPPLRNSVFKGCTYLYWSSLTNAWYILRN